MKKLIFALIILFASFSASAEIFAKMKNSAGGDIVLLTHRGKCKAGKVMFARSIYGQVWYGCWAYSDGYVYALYLNGDQMIYEAADFTFTANGKTIGGA